MITNATWTALHLAGRSHGPAGTTTSHHGHAGPFALLAFVGLAVLVGIYWLVMARRRNR